MSIFRRGDKSPEIAAIKQAFNAIGFNMVIDNEFDLTLDVATRILQRMSKITVDGVIGPNTMKALKSTLSLEAGLLKNNGIKILHKVGYQTQRDNKYNPGGTCGPTSMSMAMSFYGAKPAAGKQLEDEIFEHLQASDAQAIFKRDFPWAVGKYNPHNIHGMLQWVCNNKYVPIKDTFISHDTWEGLKLALQRGPLVVSGHFTGSGHVICLVGETTGGDIIVHDPYGNWGYGYQRRLPGECVVYNQEDLKRLVKPGGGRYQYHKFSK